VSTRLRWLDAPGLPQDLVLRHARVRASVLLGADGRPWAQLVEAGGLVAVRDGHQVAGDLVLGGCLGFDAFLAVIGELPVTVGTVRRVRVVHELHDRGRDGWIPRPGALRLTDVADASPARLCDDPAAGGAGGAGGADDPGEPGGVLFLSPEEYFRLAYDRLPAERWLARGFLVDLEVAGRAC
jgi:hypothetical protein